MSIEWTAAELDQNRLMNKARSGRTVPKGVKSAICEGCGARRSSLALYRTETAKRACRSCITGEPAADTYVAAVKVAVDIAPEPVPDALDVCNGCGINAADPDSAAGYCSDCERAAREPDAIEPVEPDAIEPDAIPADEPDDEPEPAPVRHLTYADRQAYTYCAQPAGAGAIAAPDHLGALSVLTAVGGWCELCIEYRARSLDVEPEPEPPDDISSYVGAAAALASDPEPEPAAPVLAAVETAEPSGRPSCHRCGQTFRKGGAGLSWHLANRPDCAPVALSVAI